MLPIRSILVYLSVIVCGCGKLANCKIIDPKFIHLYSGSAIITQSQKCFDTFGQVPLNGSIPLWALQMMDASAKLQSGVMSGNFMSLGDYDECMTIDDRQAGVRGKYCLVAYQIAEVAPMVYGVCIPEECNLAAMIPSREDLFYVRDDLCQTNDVILDGSDVSCIIFITFSIFLVATATFYDFYKRHHDKSDGHPTLLAFSMYTNSLKLFKVNPSEVSCLYGIRVISMMWIMYGHRASIMLGIPAINMFELLDLKYSPKSNYIYAATIMVDTFFFLSGFLVAYATLKDGFRLKLWHVPRFIIHRWLRIFPTVAVLFFIIVTISRRVGSGPIYLLGAEAARDPCVEHWWSYFFFIQNYVNPDYICLAQTWYLSLDMQMHMLSPIVLIPLGKLMRAGKMWTIRMMFFVLIASSMFIPMIISLNESNFNIYSTHWRLAVFLIGMCGGVKAVNIETFIVKTNRFIYFLIWFIVLTTMVLIAYQSRFLVQEPDSTFAIMMCTFGRPLWGVGLAWIILNCMSGQSELVNNFLSMPVFEVMSRLTFCMYVLHNLEIGYHAISTRSAIHLSEFVLVQYWISDVVITMFFSYIWTMLYEVPVIQLDKIIFGTNRPQQTKIKYTVQKI